MVALRLRRLALVLWVIAPRVVLNDVVFDLQDATRLRLLSPDAAPPHTHTRAYGATQYLGLRVSNVIRSNFKRLIGVAHTTRFINQVPGPRTPQPNTSRNVMFSV